MSIWRQLTHGLRRLFDPRAADQDVADEVEHYLDQVAAAHIARGLSPDDARRAARRELGNTTSVREKIRESLWETRASNLLAATSVRVALRSFARTPVFTITALMTLTLCLGGNLAIFAVLDSVLLRPLPFPDADRLIAIYNTYPNAGVNRDGGSIANYYERRGTLRSLASVSLYRYGSAVVGETGMTERADVVRVTPDFFTTLGVPLARGRSFTDHESVRGAAHSLIVTDAFWRTRLGGDSAVLGETVRVDGSAYTVIGMLPRTFTFLSSRATLYLPLTSLPEQRLSAARHSGSNSEMIARLAPGASVADAQREIDAQNGALERLDPDAKMMATAGFRSVVAPMHADHVASIRSTLVLLQAGVLVLVLIGVVNLANLFSIRASTRTRELMIRQSIGATTHQVLALVVVETIVLCVVGALFGIGAGAIGVRALALLGVDQLPLGTSVRFDWRAAGMTIIGAVMVGLVVALPAALHHLRASIGTTLRSESRSGTSGAAMRRFRDGFIVAQVGLAFMLVAGSLLLGASLRRAMTVQPGFRADHTITAQFDLPWQRFGDAASMSAFADRVVQLLRAQPGVQSAAIASNIPLSGDVIKSAISVRGYEARPGESLHGYYSYGVTAEYFAAIGASLRDGRLPTDDEMRGDSHMVVVDEDFAKRFWPDGGAVGRQVFEPGVSVGGNPYTIIGVIGALKQAAVTEPSGQGAVYFPLRVHLDRSAFIVVRTNADPAVYASSLARLMRGLDPDVALGGVRSMTARVDDSLIARRSPALLALVFAAVALMLAAVGTYGVLAYGVAQRRREIGVRLALGAAPEQVRRDVFVHGARLLGYGLVIGVAGVLAIQPLLGRVLFGVSATNGGALVSTVAIMTVTALVASFVPARRAAAVDPTIALAAE
jgi:putative ABC transport system permease protein